MQASTSCASAIRSRAVSGMATWSPAHQLSGQRSSRDMQCPEFGLLARIVVRERRESFHVSGRHRAAQAGRPRALTAELTADVTSRVARHRNALARNAADEAVLASLGVMLFREALTGAGNWDHRSVTAFEDKGRPVRTSASHETCAPYSALQTDALPTGEDRLMDHTHIVGSPCSSSLVPFLGARGRQQRDDGGQAGRVR